MYREELHPLEHAVGPADVHFDLRFAAVQAAERPTAVADPHHLGGERAPQEQPAELVREVGQPVGGRKLLARRGGVGRQCGAGTARARWAGVRRRR